MSFHERTKAFRKVSAVAIDVSQILTRVPVDALASATGRCRRTVLNWQNGITEPTLSDAISAMTHFAEITDAVLRAAKREPDGLSATQREALLKIIGEKK